MGIALGMPNRFHLFVKFVFTIIFQRTDPDTVFGGFDGYHIIHFTVVAKLFIGFLPFKSRIVNLIFNEREIQVGPITGVIVCLQVGMHFLLQVILIENIYQVVSAYINNQATQDQYGEDFLQVSLVPQYSKCLKSNRCKMMNVTYPPYLKVYRKLIPAYSVDLGPGVKYLGATPLIGTWLITTN